ncbi:MFS transporter [Vibrio tritonius]|uniref:MFS transporter n=1 Tax=Vibrio tritonius TaxID=1435069 RepID=UPI00315CD59E
MSRNSMSYHGYIFSHLCSIVAFRSASVVIIWALVQLFGHAESVGVLVAVMWVANILFLPISGYLLDRYAKKTVVLFCSIASVLLAFILLFSYQSFISCLILISLLSILNSAISTAPNTLIPLLVSKENLTNAIGISSTLNSLQVIIGVVVGGGVIYAVGIVNSLLATFVLYLISLLLFSFVRLPSGVKPAPSAESKALQITQGFRSLKQLKPELMFCYSAMVGNFILTPLISVVVPIYVQRTLNNDISYVVLFESSIAIGMLVGGTLSVKMNRWFNRYQQVLLGGLLIGLGVMAFAYTHTVAIKAIALFLSGMGLTIKGIQFSSLRGHAVPVSHKARIESAIFALCVLTIPLGSMAVSYAIDINLFNIDTLIMTMGGLIILSLAFITQTRDCIEALTAQDTQLENYYTTRYPRAFL